MKKPFTILLTLVLLLSINRHTIITQLVFAEKELNNEILEIHIFSPENTTYADVDIVLSCEFNREIIQSSYTVDNKENVTFTGDVIISDLSPGNHTLIVYAKDEFGNLGVSDTVVFTIKPFPSILVIISISLVGFIGFILIINAMKQKDLKNNK